MDISKKQAKWNKERPLFEAEFIHSHWLQFFNFNNNTGDYELKESHQNDEDSKLAFEVVNTGWVMWLRAKKVAVPEWISVNDRLPELKPNTWRTDLPLYVMIEGFGVSLAYPCKWNDEPFYWIPANIMCNENQAYAPTNAKNHIVGVSHWRETPKAQEQVG